MPEHDHLPKQIDISGKNNRGKSFEFRGEKRMMGKDALRHGILSV
jgi:hypothetical protein